ncbi:MAG: hypothetical protein JWP42_4021 [Pseudomonas sp.]|nr:hypothetical protein [Pseudomonas sp.]
MNILEVTKDQRDSVSHLAHEAKRVVEHAQHFIERISAICTSEDVVYRLGVSFIARKDGVTVDIISPLGVAKGSLTLVTGGQNTQGIWTVTRELESRSGEQEWVPVTSLRFSVDGNVFLSSTDKTPISSRTHLDHSRDQEAYDVLVSVLFLIGYHE